MRKAFFQAGAIFGSPTVAEIEVSMSDTLRPRIPGIIREKPGIIPTFSSFLRRKKKESNSTNWSHDPSPDRPVLLEKEKNSCFGGKIWIYLRRTPTENLPSVMGMQRVCRGGRYTWIISPSETPIRERIPASKICLIREKPSLIRPKNGLFTAIYRRYFKMFF
jgi:hypothetical protein